MSDETKDVNTSEEPVGEELLQTDFTDNVTDDHDAGVGSSADENESHQLDIDDYDKVIEEADADAEEASGETENTDDSEDGKEDESSKEDEEDEGEMIPKAKFKERLDEVIAQRDTATTELSNLRNEFARERGVLEGRLQALENAGKTQATDEADPFDELLSNGEPQQIIDALQENPGEFFTNLQRASEAKAQANIAAQQEEQKYYSDLKAGLDAFAADHEGFMENVEKMHGVVQGDPIHNLVSAFAYEVEIPAMKEAHEAAIKDYEGKIEAAKAEGIKAGKAEAMKEFKAKQSAAVLDGSQSTQGAKTVVEPELQDSAKSGGLAKVLTDKLLRRRAASGG